MTPVIDSSVRSRELPFYELNNMPAPSSHRQQMLPSEFMYEIMATCHSLTEVKGNLIGDPLDVKMFEATKWTLEENEIQEGEVLIQACIKAPKGFEGQICPNVAIIRRFEFASKLQRMSCVVKDLGQGSRYRMHLKGSPEKVREMCRENSVPQNFHKILSKYTENGYRVLAVATKAVDLSYYEIMKSTREEIEKDFIFVGFLIVENKLKDVTSSIIDVLHNADIQTIMVTGDNVLTAISVARQCHIVYPDQRIFLGELSEQKIGGKNFLLWKDFEFSKDILNDELEPELNYDNQEGYQVGGAQQEEVFYDEAEAEVPGDYDVSLIDTDPPFFNVGTDDYVVAITGKAYSHIIYEAEVNKDPKYVTILKKVLRKCLVYARMQPDEKASMIKHLQLESKKNMVGMCGDGANDCGALKTAHVGVSLSEAEASIAAPFTSKVQDISCIPNLLREGRSALVTSYQCFKYMALYSMIQFTSVTILYYYKYNLSNWNYYHEDVMAVLPFSSTMALSGTADVLTRLKPAGRLMSLNILLSVIGQVAIIMLFQIIPYFIFQANNDTLEAWVCHDQWHTLDACVQNTFLYLISIYQLSFVALAFLVGRPFRKSFYYNKWFTCYFVFYNFFNVIMNFNPFGWSFITNQTYAAESPKFTETWRWTVFYIAMANGFVTLVWERVIVKYTTIFWKNYKERKEARYDEFGNLKPPRRYSRASSRGRRSMSGRLSRTERPPMRKDS
jgi:cation-transporting ATPase 13A3/4/5